MLSFADPSCDDNKVHTPEYDSTKNAKDTIVNDVMAYLNNNDADQIDLWRSEFAEKFLELRQLARTLANDKQLRCPTSKQISSFFSNPNDSFSLKAIEAKEKEKATSSMLDQQESALMNFQTTLQKIEESYITPALNWRGHMKSQLENQITNEKMQVTIQ